jgi:hypothetical protein
MDFIHDPIVDEVRKVRNAHAKRFNNNIDEIVKDIQQRQRKYAQPPTRRSPKVKLPPTGT